MSEGGPPLPNGPSPSPTLTPLLRALKTRDLETLSMLRHTLRTPLNQIIGYSEMLMESAEETDSTAFLADLDRIHSAGGQLLALINDALAAWKIEAGKVDFAALRHDLRIPLGGVIGYTEACLDEAATEQPRRARQGPRKNSPGRRAIFSTWPKIIPTRCGSGADAPGIAGEDRCGRHGSTSHPRVTRRIGLSAPPTAQCPRACSRWTTTT